MGKDISGVAGASIQAARRQPSGSSDETSPITGRLAPYRYELTGRLPPYRYEFNFEVMRWMF